MMDSTEFTEIGKMAFRVNGNLDINFQGLDLNCGFYCLEAVMRWKHGTPYGVGVGGVQRNAHTAAVQNDMNAWYKIGFDPGNHQNDYGLVPLPKPQNAAGWEAHLRNYGPLIVAGHIGAVRIIPLMGAGHFIVVVGVNANNEIEYYDPLRPWHALGGEPATLSDTKFDELAYNQVYAAQ